MPTAHAVLTVTPWNVIREALAVYGAVGALTTYEYRGTCPSCSSRMTATSNWDTGGVIFKCRSSCSASQIERSLGLHGRRVVVTDSPSFHRLALSEGQESVLGVPPLADLRGCRVSLVWDGTDVLDVQYAIRRVAVGVEVVSS